MTTGITIANGFLHPDIIVRGKPGDRLVEGYVLPTYEQETRVGAGAYCAMVAQAGGTSCLLLDRVGSDVYGALTIDALKAAGLNTSGITRYDGAHMFCVSVVDELGNGDTMIINYPSAWRRDLASFQAEIDSVPDTLLYLYSWYWSFAHPDLEGASTASLIRNAARKGRPVLLDVNYKPATPPPANDLAQLREAAAGLDVLMPNARDAALLVGELDRVSTVRALLALGPSGVVLKCGAEGAYVAGQGEPVIHIVAPEITVLDTTGAGDSFGGGFAAAFNRGDTLVRAAAEGAAAAAFALSNPLHRKYRTLEDIRSLADTLETRTLS